MWAAGWAQEKWAVEQIDSEGSLLDYPPSPLNDAIVISRPEML